MTRQTVIALVISATALLAGLLYAVDGYAGARVLIATLFLIVGPGLALVLLLRIGDPLTAGTLAVTASLGLEALLATALLVMGWWSPGRALALVIVFTLVATAWSLKLDRGRARGASRRVRAPAASARSQTT